MTDIQQFGIRKKVLEEIKECAKKHNISKMILFGSRARGDYKEKSDIDLAVSGGNIIVFTLSVDEEVSTLLKFDVVNLDGSVQKELLDSIKKEGITIYEKV